MLPFRKFRSFIYDIIYDIIYDNGRLCHFIRSFYCDDKFLCRQIVFNSYVLEILERPDDSAANAYVWEKVNRVVKQQLIAWLGNPV